MRGTARHIRSLMCWCEIGVVSRPRLDMCRAEDAGADPKEVYLTDRIGLPTPR